MTTKRECEMVEQMVLAMSARVSGLRVDNTKRPGRFNLLKS